MTKRKPKQWVMWALKIPGTGKPLMHDTKTEAMAVADSYGWPVSAISKTLVTEVKP